MMVRVLLWLMMLLRVLKVLVRLFLWKFLVSMIIVVSVSSVVIYVG